MDKVDTSAASIFSFPFKKDIKANAKKTEEKGDVRRKKFSEIFEGTLLSSRELGPLREVAPSEEAVTELMDAVHSAGSDLLERPFSDEILKYKKAVRNFVHYVVENGYEIVKIQGIKKKIVIRGETEWKEKVYDQIKVIDHKLDKLAAAILSGQADKLEKVSKLDEISGLLVDLMVTGAIREDKNERY